MNNTESFNQLQETAVTLLRKWAESEGLFPEKEVNAFFYWFTNDKDKGHRQIAAKHLVIECISARYGNSKTFLDELQKKLYEVIDKQETTICINKVAKSRKEAEKWLNVDILGGNTLQEITETCKNGKDHTKIYVLDWNGYRIKSVTICPDCWSMAEVEDLIR